MVTYLLNIHENIRFSETLSEYQEQPHSVLLGCMLDGSKK